MPRRTKPIDLNVVLDDSLVQALIQDQVVLQDAYKDVSMKIDAIREYLANPELNPKQSELLRSELKRVCDNYISITKLVAGHVTSLNKPANA